MEWGERTGTTAALLLAVLGVALLASCSSGGRPAAEGVPVLDEVVVLERGAQRDTARREFTAADDGIYVVMVGEDDTDVALHLSHTAGAGVPASRVDVDSHMYGVGFEVGVIDVPRGARLTVLVEGAQDFDRPKSFTLRVVRYDARSASTAAISRRILALEKWTSATAESLAGNELEKTGLRDLDAALSHLESPEGDVTLAAWARLLRSRLNYRQLSNLEVSLADARRAEQGFAKAGLERNVRRARLLQAAALIEIAADKAAKNPTAEQAALEAKRILAGLSTDPQLSAFERTRCTNFLAVLAFNLYDWPDARAKWEAVMAASEAIGDRQGRRQVLQNLGVLANEEGDYRAATRYLDKVIVEADQIGSITTRTSLLLNAGGIDALAGNPDRAIERLLRALELTREHKIKHHEARVLHFLGRAYWSRGDTSQAATLLAEALKLYREVDDPVGLIYSLRYNGILAREAGEIDHALALHREADGLATTPDTRMATLLDLALDHAAALEFQRAIAISRQALAVRVGIPDYYKSHEVRLALAEALLRQARPTRQAIAEASALSKEALGGATRRADTSLEIAARRLLAQSLAAAGAYADARAEYERAIALIFSYRTTISQPELQAASMAHERQTFGGYVNLLMRDVARREPGTLKPAGAAEETALRTLEWARALNFGSGRISPVDAATQAKIDELLTQMAGKRVRIAALNERESEAKHELAILQLDIAQLRAKVDGLRAAAYRGTDAAAQSPGVTPRWSALPKGITQISYAIDSDGAYIWVRDGSGIRASRLPSSSADLTAALTRLTAAIHDNDPVRVEQVLKELSRVLIPPDALAAGTDTFEVVAEGEIARVPFASLQAAKRSVVMIGSMFETRTQRHTSKPRPLGFVAVASDARAKRGSEAARVFPALLRASGEARTIATLFQAHDPHIQVKMLLGAEGGARELEDVWRRGAGVFHFATHGLADMRQPMASLLLLPALDAAGNPTYLTAGQVQEWRGDADLVYLGACETAVGPARFADGLPGLQRAFLRAGARGVIATLWPVEDVYGSQFATDFYRRYTAGLRASEALSETQRAWMEPAAGISEREQAHRRMTAWAYAFYSN